MKLRNFLLAVFAFMLAITATAQITSPSGITFDSSGHLWVATGTANQVLEIDPSNGNVLNTITEGVNNPTRLCFATNSILYVANSSGNNITAYNIQTLKLVRTVSDQASTSPWGFLRWSRDRSIRCSIGLSIVDG